MQVVRKIVDRKSIKAVVIPEEFGERVELIVLPLDDEKYITTESLSIMKLQEKSGFAAQVLADVNEDVWNEL